MIGEWILESRASGVSEETVNVRAYALGLGLGIGFRVKFMVRSWFWVIAGV